MQIQAGTPTPTLSSDLQDLLNRAIVSPDDLHSDKKFLNETMAKLKDWQPSGHEGDERLAVQWVDVLDAAMSRLDVTINPELYGQLFRRMRKICSAAGNLPTSFYVPDDIEQDEEPICTTMYSKVYRGMRPNGLVALKHFLVHKDRVRDTRKAYCKEAVTLRYVTHRNIVPFYGVLSPSSGRDLVLVSRWMPNGNLMQYLIKHPDENRLTFMVHTLDGLAFIHSLGVAHGDLKADNVLVDHTPVARLADFGFTVSISHTLATTGKSPGTVGFVAPEILASEVASVPGDIYAFASLLYQIFEMKRPFWNKPYTDDRLKRKIIHDNLRPEPRPSQLTETIWKMMQACWAKSPLTRPGIPPVLMTIKSEMQYTADA